MNTGILRHPRRGQDRRDAGGLPGGGAVGNLCQRGHASGRRPRHGFALTRKFSSHLRTPWRDFSVFKVTRQTGGAEARRESWRGEERGDLGTASGDDGPQRATFAGEVMAPAVGVGFSPYPLSPPRHPPGSRVGSREPGQQAGLPPEAPRRPPLNPTPAWRRQGPTKGRAAQARP